MTKSKVGIALGSGAARGWSHIGVLQALAEEEIEARRRRYHLKALVTRQVEEVPVADSDMTKGDLRSSYNRLLNSLGR